MRLLLRVVVVAGVVGLVGAPTEALALRVAYKPPAQRALSADAVLVGKVVSVGQDLAELPSPYAGAEDKIRYKVATVKVTEGLIGVGRVTEVKVAFPPPPKPVQNPNQPPVGAIRPPVRGGLGAPELKEGQELVLFLTKHPSADAYIIAPLNPPLDLKDEQGRKDLATVKRIAALLADPLKGLKSDKADERAEAAAALVMKYRAFPELGGMVEQVAIPAEESRLILQALAGGDWGNQFRPDSTGLSPIQAFYQLGLSEKDGWVQPVVVNVPGAPPVDFNAVMKDAFLKWLEGPGKNYVLKKNVAKPTTPEK